MRLLFVTGVILVFFGCKDKLPSIPESIQTEESEVSNTQEPSQEIDLSVIMGKFEPAEHKDFSLIDKTHADREGLYLQEETYAAYKKMYAAAAADGIKLVIRSATRNFNYQRGIWERKWEGNKKSTTGIDEKSNALKILEYSSMPGTSRHHWGTDIDLNAFENSWFEKGEGLELYNWLQTHAAEYGFCQVYSPKDDTRPNGYNEEKWHWSYLPIASKYYDLAKAQLNNEMISGFKGASVAKELEVVEKYILGINKSCTEWH